MQTPIHRAYSVPEAMCVLAVEPSNGELTCAYSRRQLLANVGIAASRLARQDLAAQPAIRNCPARWDAV